MSDSGSGSGGRPSVSGSTPEASESAGDRRVAAGELGDRSPRPGRTGRADPPDPALVAERVARLTTDQLVTRRGYLRILGVLSGGLALGSISVAAGAFRRPTQGATEELVITEDAEGIPIGGSVRFTYPNERSPALLVRLDEQTFVAYSAVCTHLQCEVLARREEGDLYCPCHEGFFDPATGAPTAGPPDGRCRASPSSAAGPPSSRSGKAPSDRSTTSRRDMSQPPRPIRPLPGTPAPDTDEGLRTGLTTRMLIVATIVLGQLWALTVGLEEHLSGHTDRAWWLAGFSVLSFVVTAALVWLEPPARSHRGRR